jgi:hypothetical protein
VVARNDLDELLELDALHRVEERTVAATLSSDYDIVSIWEKLCLGHVAPPAVAPWRGIVINFEFWFINRRPWQLIHGTWHSGPDCSHVSAQ